MGVSCRRRAGTATLGGAALARAACDASSPAQLGPYRLLRIVGEGGMARVYVAEHEGTLEQRAVKTLRPEYALNVAARAMLEREARIAGTIRHPSLLDVGPPEVDAYGRPYYAMELVVGETLADRLARGVLPLSQALDVVIRVADAVAAIHRAGYLHRDVKADNVLLARDGRRLAPKLIDFGVARALEVEPGADAVAEGIVGTPHTMAPEQIAQDAVDERADVWALGVLLYEMLAGRLPFPVSRSLRDDLVAIVTEPPRPLPLVVARDVRTIVDDCLRKDPEDRPPSAAALVDRLRRAQAELFRRDAIIGRLARAG